MIKRGVFEPFFADSEWHKGCSNTLAMTTRKLKRSAVYHLLNTIAPKNHKLKAELDVAGAIVIIGMLLGMIAFARYFLF